MKVNKENAERALKHFCDLSYVGFVHEFLKACVEQLPSRSAHDDHSVEFDNNRPVIRVSGITGGQAQLTRVYIGLPRPGEPYPAEGQETVPERIEELAQSMLADEFKPVLDSEVRERVIPPRGDL